MVKLGSTVRQLCLAGAVAACGLGLMAAPASAHWHGYHHGRPWHPYWHGYAGGYYPPPVVVAPSPARYYAPPPVVYSPGIYVHIR